MEEWVEDYLGDCCSDPLEALEKVVEHQKTKAKIDEIPISGVIRRNAEQTIPEAMEGE